MATETWQLTEDEIALIDEVYNMGVLDDAGWARFFQRVRRAPRREGAIESALLEEGITGRLDRDFHGIVTGFSDPRHGLEAAEEHFREKGVVGGLADIAAQAVTTPLRAGSQIASGSLGESPLETIVGAASVIPVGRVAAGALSTGAGVVGRAGLASALARTARSPKWINASRAVELGDIVTGINEWPLEVIGEGMLDVGASGLSRLGQYLAERPTEDLSADGPPPDVPPEQPTQQQPPPEQPQPTQPPADNNIRTWKHGDTGISITAKRVPSSEGVLDNRHWQVYFDGPGVEDYGESSPFNFGPDDNITSYEQARDAGADRFVQMTKPREEETQAESRQRREQQAANNRETRRQNRQQPAEQPAETVDDIVEKYTQLIVDSTPIEDMGEFISPMYDDLNAIGVTAVEDHVKIQEQVINAAGERMQTQQASETTEESTEYDEEALIEMIAESSAHWMVEYGVDETGEEIEVEQSVNDTLYNAYQEGFVESEEHAERIKPAVLARVEVLIPEIEAEAERRAAEHAERQKIIQNAVDSAKFTKANEDTVEVVQQDSDEKIEVKGHKLTGIGFDYADIVIHRSPIEDDNRWVVSEKITGRSLAFGNTRKEAVSNAAVFLVDKGEADFIALRDQIAAKQQGATDEQQTTEDTDTDATPTQIPSHQQRNADRINENPEAYARSVVKSYLDPDGPRPPGTVVSLENLLAEVAVYEGHVSPDKYQRLVNAVERHYAAQTESDPNRREQLRKAAKEADTDATPGAREAEQAAAQESTEAEAEEAQRKEEVLSNIEDELVSVLRDNDLIPEGININRQDGESVLEYLQRLAKIIRDVDVNRLIDKYQDQGVTATDNDFFAEASERILKLRMLLEINSKLISTDEWVSLQIGGNTAYAITVSGLADSHLKNNTRPESVTGTQTESSDTSDADTPIDTNQTPAEERDWAGLDVDIAVDIINQLQENPDADARALLNIQFSDLIQSGTLSEADAYTLRPIVEGLIENELAKVETSAETPPEETPTPEVGSTQTALADIIKARATDDQTPEQKLENAIYYYLRSTIDSQTLTAEQLFAGATEAYGGDNYNSQTVYDVMEVAANRYIASKGMMETGLDAVRARGQIARIISVERRLPRQADRTAEREQNQQYSTPFHYSYLVNWVANLQENDIVLEPSAGTGNLAWYAKQEGLEVHVNDIGKIRYRLLQDNFENATNVNAIQIDKRLQVKPTLVIMNPPFSSTQGQQKNTLLGVNMVEAALKTLQPGGRLVAIVNGGRDLTDAMVAGEKPGGGPNFDSQQYRKWWNRIVNEYQVRANLHVSGEVYKGFGTNFNTRLLVIDKRLGGEAVYPLRGEDGQLKPEYSVMHKKRVDTISEAVEILESIRQMRTRSPGMPSGTPTQQEGSDEGSPDTQQQPDQQTREETPDTTAGGRSVPPTEPETRTSVSTEETESLPDDVLPDADGVDATDTRGELASSEPRDVDGETEDTESGTPGSGVEVAGDGETTLDTADRGPDTGRGVGDRDTGDAALRREGGGSASVSTEPAQETVGADTNRSGDPVLTRDGKREGVEDPQDVAKVWVPTEDSHIVKGRRVNLQETVSLGTIKSPEVSEVDINIPADFLDRYSQAQQKAIRLILRSHQSHIEPEVVGDTPPRQGFYDGDDTGVGKTWIAAGTIIHNQNEGRKKHVLVTATQNLIKDFQEAFPIAGGNADALFNITEGVKKNGVLITTYNTIAGQRGDPTRISEILEWATGEKPPQSILNPQTDTELMMFGELPKTIELAWNMYNAGESLPSRVTELMDRLKQFDVSISSVSDHWKEQYADILAESDAIRAAEGGTTPAAWAENAKKFDGVIVYDESHRMKKSKGRDASAAGIRGTQLARLLPNARVIYLSATGTTEISNMAYMERLGIWGRNKPFANAEDFISEMEQGGIASQEVVARDLKAKGLFISRSLDFSDVVVRSLVHELSEEQIQTYNELANVWQEIRLYLFNYAQGLRDLAEDVEDGVANTGDEIGDIWSEYYSKQQRFFQAMLDAMKMQSVIPDMMAQIDAGKKVTIQIVNTYESNQDRQEQRAQRAGIDMGEVELSAREILEDYLNEETGVLPIYDYEVILDAETGENMLRLITNDTDQTMEMSDGTRVPPGAPIPNMERVAKRNELLDLVFKSFLPASPLDQFVQAFKNRGLEIAESTGRKARYYQNEAGERVKEELKPSRVRADVKQFNENKLFGLAFSKAGATGANYPATDPQHPIVQYVIQVGWQADDFKQGLGRSKRANEVVPPEIVNTATNMVGELRFQSTAASRAAELGATTRGQAQEGTGLDLFSFDAKYLDTDYGKNALYNLVFDLYTGSTIPVEGEVDRNGNPLVIGWNDGEGITSFLEVTGLDVKIDSQTGRPSTDRFPPVKRFMNRVLGAPSIALQNALYNAFFSRMSGALEEAKADGTLDTGIDTLQTESATIQEDYVLYTDPDTGAETYATLLDIEEKTEVMGWSDVQEQLQAAERTGKSAAFFLTDDGDVYLDIETSTRTDDFGRPIQRLRRTGPEGRKRYLDATVAYPENVGARFPVYGISESDLADIQQAWEAQLADVPLTKKSNVLLVRGLMIDVWDKINRPIDDAEAFRTSDSRRAEQVAARKLIRVILDDGTNIIGRRFQDRTEFQEMLQAFGKDPESVSTVKQRVNGRDVQQMLDDGFSIELNNGFTIRRRTRAGQPYYAVEGTTSTLEGLVNDRVLQKVRPSGGAMTYVLPDGNANAFLDRYPPVAAVKGNNRTELEYTHPDLPTPPPDDEGGEGGEGGSTDTTPDSTPDRGGAASALPTANRRAGGNVPTDNDASQTTGATRTNMSDSGTGSSPRERVRDVVERQEAQRNVSVKRTAQAVRIKLSSMELEDALRGTEIHNLAQLREHTRYQGKDEDFIREDIRRQVREQIEADMTTPPNETTTMTDEQKIEMTVEKVSEWVLDDIRAGMDSNEALDKHTKDSIWHGNELYALDTFTGQSPEQVRDYFRKEITSKVNTQGLTRGGRGFKMLKPPELLAEQPETPETPQFNFVDGDSIRQDPQAILHYLQTAEIGEPREIATDSPYIKHGILEFPIGEYGTARVSKPDPEHPFIKNSTVYFQLNYSGAGGNDPDITSAPIEAHLFSKQTIRPERFIDDTRKQKLTLEKVEKALSDDPEQITGVGRVTAGLPTLPEGYISPTEESSGLPDIPVVPEGLDEQERARLGSLVWETVLERLPDDAPYEMKQLYSRRLEARLFDQIRVGADVDTVIDQLEDFVDEIVGDDTTTPQEAPVEETPAFKDRGVIAMDSVVGENRAVAEIIENEAKIYEARGGTLENAAEKIIGIGFNQTSKRKILYVDRGYGEPDSDVLFYVQSPETTDATAMWKINIRNRADKKNVAMIEIPRQGGIRPKQQIIKSAEDAILKLMRSVETQLQTPQEAPDEPQTPTRSDGEDQTPEGSTPDISSATPVQPTETPDTDSGAESPDTASEDIPETQYIYQGATFTEENGTLSITGDAIPESFWDYYHSGGRGRNSAHKRAMKEAGWNYTFSGSKPRIYTFSISIPDFNRWKAAHPDDGSAPVDLAEQGTPEQLALMDDLRQATIEVVVTDPSAPWRDSSHHFVFEGVEGVRAIVRRETDHRRNARSYLKDSYEVSLYGDAIENVRRSIAWRDMEGINEDNFSDHDNKKAAISAALENIEAAHLDLKPKPEEIPQTPDAPEEQLFAGVLEKIENGQFTRDGNEYLVDIEGLGKVGVYFSTAKVASGMIGEMTETIETKISFSSKESPQTFKYLSIDVPEEVVTYFNNRFENEHLAEIRDTRNWERLGRKHAFKHKLNGAIASVSKHFTGKYQVAFSDMPKMGVSYVLIEGANLTERFHNGLAELQPYMFTDEVTKQGQVLDTLRLKTGKETSFANAEDTPSPEDTSESDDELLENMEAWRETTHGYITTYASNPVEGQPGVYEAEIEHDGMTDTIRWTVTRGHIATQPGLFGREEPVRYDLAKHVKIESELFDPITRTVDLANAETVMEGTYSHSESADMREDNPEQLAIEMVHQQLKPEDLTLSLEVGVALSELGLMDITEWRQLTPAQQTTELNNVTTRLYEASDDNSLTQKQTKAINILQERSNKWERQQVYKPVSGGAPLVQTLETVRDVPDDIPPAEVKKPKKWLRMPAGTRLQEKIDGVTPKMKLWLERSRREYLSGYKNLETLGPIGEAIRAGAEYMASIEDRGSTNDFLKLEPHQKALLDLTKQRTPQGASAEVVGARLSEQIFRFIEDNTPIENDAELLAVAEGWKEAWRSILLSHVLHMLQLRREIDALEGDEQLVIRRSDGSVAKPWSPLLPGHIWDDERQMFQREADKAWLTAEQAIRESHRLYMPHSYPSSH